MKHLKILEEIQRTPWAMTLPSFRSMLSVLDDEGINSDDYQYFHGLTPDDRDQAADTFGRPIEGRHYASIQNNVGFLMVDGPIVPRANRFNDVSGMTSLDILTADFLELESDPTVDTIAMLFDSPGGAAKGLSDFTATVRASKKKTIAFTWMAASAAYWMASAANEIISPPDGRVGSIGVVATIRDYRKADEKRGIRNLEIVSTQSPQKRPDIDTDEGRAEIQKMVDDMAGVFIDEVARGRGVDKQEVLDNYGKGAMLIAGRAQIAGMINDIQTADAFAKSIIKTEFTYQLSTISASAEQPKMEVSIMNVKELKAEHPDVYEEIVASAKVEERDRLKSIEALLSDFDNSNTAFKSAATNLVDREKWDSESSKDSVSKALSALRDAEKIEAQSQESMAAAIDEHGGPRRAAAKLAGELSKANPKEVEKIDPEAADESHIDLMLKASEAEGRIR